MILAETLKTLTAFTAPALSRAVISSGYTDAEFKTAEFLGITNGGQFCYKVTYYDENLGEDSQGKVFLTFDHSTGAVTADY